MRMRRHIAFAVPLLTLTPACLGQAQFVFLEPEYAGVIHDFGGSATAVDAAGTVVVGYHSIQCLPGGDGTDYAFAWTLADGFQVLTDDRVKYPEVRCISADGSKIAGHSQGPNPFPFVWDRSNGNSLEIPTAYDSQWWTVMPLAISGDGERVFGQGERVFVPCDATAIQQAFVWGMDNVVRDLDPTDCITTPAVTARATASSYDGGVVVGSRDSRAFRWTANDGFQSIGPPQSEALDVSWNGNVILVTTQANIGRWTAAEEYQVITTLPHSRASLSADGSTVVGGYYGNSWIWTETTGVRSLRELLITRYGLDLRGWCLSPQAINFDGSVIVGQATNPQGRAGPFWLKLESESAGGCSADFDRTGFVDTDDFDAFVQAFEAGDRIGDFDGSCFVDTDDFDAFVMAFEAGC